MHKKDQKQKIIIGNAVFKKLPAKVNQMIRKSMDLQFMIKQNEWIINERWENRDDDWQLIFLYMSECLTQQIRIQYQNYGDKVLWQIQSPRYVNLKILKLSHYQFNSAKNRIRNIQPLSFMHFQCLQQLNLNNNKISQINCVNRLSVHSLSIISLHKNPIIDINILSKSKIHPKKLKSLSLQSKLPYLMHSIPIQQDLSVLVKLNSESVQQIVMQLFKRIRQDKIKIMFQSRFPFIKYNDDFNNEFKDRFNHDKDELNVDEDDIGIYIAKRRQRLKKLYN